MPRFFAPLFIALLAGCAALRTLEKTAPAPTDEESIFIIGFSPAQYSAQIRRGSVVKYDDEPSERFRQSEWDAGVTTNNKGAPQSGYIVGKATKGDAIAVAGVHRPGLDDESKGEYFWTCGDNRTLVFTAPGKRVIYLGDIVIESDPADKSRLTMTYRQNIDAARAYLEANYPNLKGQLVAWPYQMTRMTLSCNPVRGIHMPPIPIVIVR